LTPAAGHPFHYSLGPFIAQTEAEAIFTCSKNSPKFLSKPDQFAMDKLYETVLGIISDNHLTYRQELPNSPKLLKERFIIPMKDLILKPW
jgi:hypothetical protein